jgi:plasmid stability protein
MWSLHNDCVVTMTVRNVPDAVRNTLAANAARAGQSMQEYTLGLLIQEASRRPQTEVLAEVRARARTMPPLASAEVEAGLRADRR